MSTAAWLIPLALIYFVALLMVAFEPHEPGRRARHRLDKPGPADTAVHGDPR